MEVKDGDLEEEDVERRYKVYEALMYGRGRQGM